MVSLVVKRAATVSSKFLTDFTGCEGFARGFSRIFHATQKDPQRFLLLCMTCFTILGVPRQL